MKDLKETGISALRSLPDKETLYAKGANERTAMGIIRPLVTENHPLNNPTLNYSVYLK